MKHFDMFSGYGGFTITCKEFGIETIGFSEIDKYAIAVYKYHFPEIKNYGDIRIIQGKGIKADIITFGSPCQDLSTAGKQEGIKGRKSRVFDDAIRLLNEIKPNYFIFENVKGLFSSNKGKDFEYVLQKFADAGYDGQWQLVNGLWFLPQNRERIFFVGHIRKKSRPKIFPITEEIIKKTTKTNKKGVQQIAQCLMRKDYQNWNGNFVMRYPLKYLNRNQKNIKGDYSFAIDTMQTSGVKIKNKIRRFTPVECERLMGLPDNWTKEPNISDTQRYKLCGNGVIVNVVREIIKRLL